MNIPMDFDLKLEPNGSEEYGVYHFLLDTRGKSFPERMWTDSVRPKKFYIKKASTLPGRLRS